MIQLSIIAAPTLLILFKKWFRRNMGFVVTYFWDSDKEFNWWMDIRERYLFTLEDTVGRVVTWIIVVAGVDTILVSGVPFAHPLTDSIALLTLSVVFWICGQTLYMCYALLVTLHDLAHRQIGVPFFYPIDRAFSPLLTPYSGWAFLITIYYLMLLAAVWRGPYGFSYAMLTWMSLLAIVPLFFFVVSFGFIREMVVRVKVSHIINVNKIVTDCLDTTRHNDNSDDIEKLDKMMDVQAKVQSMREWPVSIGPTLTFAVTVIIAVAQVYLAFTEG